jgi:hypothetical protein
MYKNFPSKLGVLVGIELLLLRHGCGEVQLFHGSVRLLLLLLLLLGYPLRDELENCRGGVDRYTRVVRERLPDSRAELLSWHTERHGAFAAVGRTGTVGPFSQLLHLRLEIAFEVPVWPLGREVEERLLRGIIVYDLRRANLLLDIW